MKQNRSRASILNLGSSGIKNIISTLIGFVSTPFLIHSVGDSDFGIYRTLMGLFGHFSILEFGLYSTILSFFIKAAGENDERATQEILHWSIKKYTRVMHISLALSLVASIWIFFKFRNDTNDNDLLMTLVFCQAFFVILPMLPYRAYLEANHQAYKVNFILLMNSLIYTGSAFIFTFFMPGVSSLMLATMLALVISQYLYVRQTPARLRVTVETSELKVNHKVQTAFFLNEISGRICFMSDDIIISFMIGPKYVVPFFITQKLPQLIQTQLLNIGNSTWSTLGVLYHGGEQELFKKRLIELTKVSSVFGCACLLVLVLFNKSFVELWLGAPEFAGLTFTLVACLNAFFLPILTIWGWSFNYSQLVEKLTPMLWAQAAVNLSLSIVLTHYYGILGTALGTLFAYILVPLPMLSYLLKKHFSIGLTRLTIAWSLPLILTSFLCYGCFMYPAFFESHNWFGLIFKMCLVGAISLMVLVLIFFSREEMRENAIRVKRILKR